MSSRAVNYIDRIRFKMCAPSHTTEIHHASCAPGDEFLLAMAFCATPVVS